MSTIRMWIGLLFPLVWVWIVSVIDKISLYANADVCLLFRDNSNTIENDEIRTSVNAFLLTSNPCQN